MNRITCFSIPFMIAFLFVGMFLFLVGFSHLLVTAQSASSYAGEIMVNTLENEQNDDGDCSLREAIASANTNDFVDACATGGVLTDTIVFDVAGMIPVTNPLMVMAGGPLLINGGESININGGESDQIFSVEIGAQLTLDSLTLSDGFAIGNGGGIYNNGTLVITNTSMDHNRATEFGGGIYNDGWLTINGSIFTNNEAYIGGGCIYHVDIEQKYILKIYDSTFTYNSAGDGGGCLSAFSGPVDNNQRILKPDAHTSGGIDYSDAPISIVNSTFSQNTAGLSGAIDFSSGTISIVNSTISGNHATYTVGGGISCFGWCTLNITGSNISGNSAAQYGGGIYHQYGVVTIEDSTVSGNSASMSGGGILALSDLYIFNSTMSDNFAYDLGGGIYNSGFLTITSANLLNNNTGNSGAGIYNIGDVNLIQSTLSGNSAGQSGGGIYTRNDWPGDSTEIINSTIAGNTAPSCGGIFNEGLFNSTNTTVAGNNSSGVCNEGGQLAMLNSIVAENVPADCVGEINDGGHNISLDTSCNFSEDNGSMPGTDPLLGPLQDNGGPTWTRALLEGSPAIDSGDDANCPATDQRGVVRPQDGNRDGTPVCDIGSYEVEGPNVPPHSVTIIGYESGWIGDPFTFSATTEPISTSLPLDYLWEASGQEDIAHSGGITDSVSFTWDTLGNQTITVTASNDYGLVMDTSAITIYDHPISGLSASNDSPTMLGRNTTLSATIITGTNPIFTWDYGDGLGGDGAIITHTYEAVGIYTATVTATNTTNSQTATTLVTITTPEYPVYLPLVITAKELPLSPTPALPLLGDGVIVGLTIIGIVSSQRRRR